MRYTQKSRSGYAFKTNRTGKELEEIMCKTNAKL